MGTWREAWVHANQFSPSLRAEVDFPINAFSVPVGSTLKRTWVDVRFNRIGLGTEPPEFINQTGPTVWGLCYTDDVTTNPGTDSMAEGIDWLWREMVVFGPAVRCDNSITGDPQWMEVAQPTPGWRSSKGQRKRNNDPAYMHWCFDTPSLFSTGQLGISWEVFVHALFDVP